VQDSNSNKLLGLFEMRARYCCLSFRSPVCFEER
jgi:hypothetical protein